MSTLRAVIYSTLKDDPQLQTLLDKSSDPFGIYWHHPPQNPNFPIITFFIGSESDNFPRQIPYMITAWTGNFAAVLNRIFDLFHDKTLQELDDYGFVLSRYDWSSPEMYDEEYKIHYRQDRYILTGIKKGAEDAD
jgi:hypothetical protein